MFVAVMKNKNTKTFRSKKLVPPKFYKSDKY